MIEGIIKGTLALVFIVGGIAGICYATDSTPNFDIGPDVCAGGIDGTCIRPIVCRYAGIEGFRRLVVAKVEDCPTIKMIQNGRPSDTFPVKETPDLPRAKPEPRPPKGRKNAKRKVPIDEIACRAAPEPPLYGPPDGRPWVEKEAPLMPCDPPPAK